MTLRQSSLVREEAVLELYKTHGYRYIERELKIHQGTIKKILDKNNVIQRLPIREHPIRKIFFNQRYFQNIDTGEKAYWLGFWYGDGCVQKESRHQGVLNQGLKDILHLYKFADMINFPREYVFVRDKQYYENKGVGPGPCFARVTCSSRDFAEDLVKHGCVRQKTKRLEMPKLRRDLYRYFINGFFDADGCCMPNKNGNGGKIDFVSCSGNFLWAIDDMLMKELGIKGGKRKTFNNGNYYRLVYFRKDTILKIYQYFYKDSTVYLDRKKKKFEEILSQKCSQISFTPL